MSPAERRASPDPLVPPGAQAAGSGPLLAVHGLRKRFGGHEVLRSIDLTVARGEVLALIGPSGSGKTTVLRCLNGLETPDGGTIRVGPDLRLDFATAPSRAARALLRDRSAMVFQHYNLFPHKTVLENVLEGPVTAQKRRTEEVRSEAVLLLDRVGLSRKHGAYPSELSGGQQQRVGIVRALALRPQLLLFDEPTSALDAELVGEVLSLISDLAHQGWTMVIVTHELQFAREVADHVAFVDEGIVVERGRAEELLHNPTNERTKRFLRRLLH